MTFAEFANAGPPGALRFLKVGHLYLSFLEVVHSTCVFFQEVHSSFSWADLLAARVD